jgi:hypothetical protein
MHHAMHLLYPSCHPLFRLAWIRGLIETENLAESCWRSRRERQRRLFQPQDLWIHGVIGVQASVTSERRVRPRSLLLVVAAWRAQRSDLPTEKVLR